MYVLLIFLAKQNAPAKTHFETEDSPSCSVNLNLVAFSSDAKWTTTSSENLEKVEYLHEISSLDKRLSVCSRAFASLYGFDCSVANWREDSANKKASFEWFCWSRLWFIDVFEFADEDEKFYVLGNSPTLKRDNEDNLFLRATATPVAKFGFEIFHVDFTINN